MYKIITDSLEDMITICAGLVKNGINFEAKWQGGNWVIECTGGY